MLIALIDSLLYYEDIVNEPFVTIQKIYDKFGIEFNDDAENLLREFLSNNPRVAIRKTPLFPGDTWPG